MGAATVAFNPVPRRPFAPYPQHITSKDVVVAQVWSVTEEMDVNVEPDVLTSCGVVASVEPGPNPAPQQRNPPVESRAHV